LLKIKDNVDLDKLIKKLEKKYKFEKVCEEKEYYLLILRSWYEWDNDWEGKKFKLTSRDTWQIWKDKRTIRYLGTIKPYSGRGGFSVYEDLDFVFDLIKDDLVEKVE